MKAKIRVLTHKTSQQDFASVLVRLAQIMRGWANYFRHAVAKWTLLAEGVYACRMEP
ncbi:group II intron maturase-specific domain-containing protein [Kitasatospora sp. NPDC101155]|uniref:group II intron maturase-specific domain-containing protein n=1 Tax=Kitasatospora sp. NPDC101155 TaxID=3364097 RepID=UPI0038278AB0